jgi:ribose transport system ATP-binding protein
VPATSPAAAQPVLLEMRGITKRFPGVTALQDVALTLRSGEVLALMGENGAGKSTLMKVLGGAYAPDEGAILIDGREAPLRSVRDARRLGIALIHQELMLAPNLDITANIFLGNEGLARRSRPAKAALFAPIPRGKLARRTAGLLARVGLRVPPQTLVSALTTGQMQMVEIAKALSLDARILVMDEPTSSLTASESAQLFAIVRQLRDEGLGIVYISHRMEEVLQLADRITVLRDGRYVGDLPRDAASHHAIVAMMIGRELSGHYFPARQAPADAAVVLEVKDLVVPGARARISFSAKRGEILGFAGLVGAGRTELMQTIFGVTPAPGGEMTLGGEPFAPGTPREAIDAGVFLVPEDRKRHGLVLPMSVAENTTLPNVAHMTRWGVLDWSAERRVAETQAARLRTKTPSVLHAVVGLSGGNQQKVVLAKWLALSPRVLILDEPTRGIDVAAKAEIYQEIAGLAERGITILLVSSELEEVIGLCDRVVVMREGRIAGIVSRERLTGARVAALMTGQIEGDPSHEA